MAFCSAYEFLLSLSCCPHHPSPSFAQSSEEFAASGSRVPRKVLQLLKREGASVSRGMGITLVDIDSCEAMVVLNSFMNSLSDDDDPLLSVAGAASIPLLLECQSILQHFSGLRKVDFDGGAHLLVHPMQAPSSYHRFHCAFALAFVNEFLSNPGPNFPHIHGLAHGVTVCRICQVWAGGTTVILTVQRT